jgi:hypothetical protein
VAEHDLVCSRAWSIWELAKILYSNVGKLEILSISVPEHVFLGAKAGYHVENRIQGEN